MIIGVLDDVGREGEEDSEEEGGVEGVFRTHRFIWEVEQRVFAKRRSALIHKGTPFRSIYLCVLNSILLLFHPSGVAERSICR